MTKNSARTVYNVAVFLILEAASLWFLSTSSELHRSWIGQGATSLMAVIWSPFDAIGQYFSLRKENTVLAEENIELFNKLQEIKSSVNPENDLWKTRGYDFEFIPGTIVAKSRNSQHSYVIVDRGLNDGIREGDGIVTPKGVVGIVQSVSSNYCYAITFMNIGVSVSAKLGLDGFVGNMTWDGKSSNKAILSGIPLHVKFEIGDTVYTSGHSSVFPSDIPVAVIESSKIRGGSSAEINVKLFEDFSCTRCVMMVRNNDREEIEQLLEDACHEKP